MVIVLEPGTEPAEIDLTRDGLGDRCPGAAVEGMLGSHRAQSSPDGQAWAPLAAATIRRKGNAVKIDQWAERVRIAGRRARCRRRTARPLP